jgi:cytochrome d ubiquinol oxidase subunit II
MTWVAVILTPLVLLYQGWTYWVFRKRISAAQIPESIGLTFARSGSDAR